MLENSGFFANNDVVFPRSEPSKLKARIWKLEKALGSGNWTEDVHGKMY